MIKTHRYFLLLILVILISVFIVVWIHPSSIMSFRLLDFENFVTASRMIWHGINPYGSVEYFAPPWLAILIGPFLLIPLPIASFLWLLINVLCILLTSVVSIYWMKTPRSGYRRMLLIIGFSVMPASFFSLIIGTNFAVNRFILIAMRVAN